MRCFVLSQEESCVNIIPLFPTILFETKIEIKPEWVQHCLEKEKQNRGLQISNIGGYHSENDAIFDDEFVDLVNVLESLVNSIHDNLVLDSGWINVNRKNHYNECHTHPLGALSCCVYLSVPKEKESKISFFDPRPAASFTSPQYGSKGTTFSKIVNAGDVLIFPSWLPHSVLINNTDEPRISIACNYITIPHGKSVQTNSVNLNYGSN